MLQSVIVWLCPDKIFKGIIMVQEVLENMMGKKVASRTQTLKVLLLLFSFVLFLWFLWDWRTGIVRTIPVKYNMSR